MSENLINVQNNLQVIHAVCPHDCPDTCSMNVTVQDGKAIKVVGNPDHQFTDGFLCSKVSKYLDRVYHSGRVLYPQRRV
ncbi:MAG: molybdopterin oxidoreductase family protein, partial [Blastocatellia bacterium]